MTKPTFPRPDQFQTAPAGQPAPDAPVRLRWKRPGCWQVLDDTTETELQVVLTDRHVGAHGVVKLSYSLKNLATEEISPADSLASAKEQARGHVKAARAKAGKPANKATVFSTSL